MRNLRVHCRPAESDSALLSSAKQSSCQACSVTISKFIKALKAKGKDPLAASVLSLSYFRTPDPRLCEEFTHRWCRWPLLCFLVSLAGLCCEGGSFRAPKVSLVEQSVRFSAGRETVDVTDVGSLSR